MILNAVHLLLSGTSQQFNIRQQNEYPGVGQPCIDAYGCFQQTLDEQTGTTKSIDIVGDDEEKLQTAINHETTETEKTFSRIVQNALEYFHFRSGVNKRI